MKNALVWKSIHPYNYYHFLLENGPLVHDHLCRYFGDCNFGPGNAAIFAVFEHRHKYDSRLAIFDEITACFSSKVVPIFPLGELWGSQYGMNAEEVILVDTLVAGFGHTRREHFSVDAHMLPSRWQFMASLKPLEVSVGWSFRNRLRECLGLDASGEVAALDPVKVRGVAEEVGVGEE